MAANSLYNAFWDETFWFPANRSHGWDDLVNKPGSSTYYPDINHLNWALVLGIGLLGVRYILETVIVVPIAIWLGVPSVNVRTVAPNAQLEKAYKDKDTHNYKIIKSISKQTDLTERQIEIWFRKRQKMDSATPMMKFRECSWHLVFYTIFFIYAMVYLWQKDYFWTTIECYRNWPTQHITDDMYWHYMLELGFYWGLVFTMFSDTKRKDFNQMMLHHVATIILLYFSWVLNFVRAGTLILVVHDAADTWLALGKMCDYMKNKKATDIFFSIFCIIWILTRLIAYPFIVLYCTAIEPYTIKLMDSSFGSHKFFNFFLFLLMGMHIIWSYMIGKIVYNRVMTGQNADVRSDTEEEVEDEDTRGSRGRHIKAITKNGTLSNGTLSDGTLSNGTLSNGTLSNGTLSNGTLSNRTISNGTLSNGTLANGTLSNGTNGTLKISNGIQLAGTNGIVNKSNGIANKSNSSSTNGILRNGK